MCADNRVAQLKIECRIEIYHHLKCCFSRGFETDGNVGLKLRPGEYSLKGPLPAVVQFNLFKLFLGFVQRL